MTEVHFYTGVADQHLAACALVRKSVERGRKVVVYCSDAAALAAFDRTLWSFDPIGFVPHVQAGDPLADRTPVVLTDVGHADDNTGHVPHHDVLVNLDRASPLFFSRFDFLMEMVGAHDDDQAAGRTRWKFYKDRGYAVHHHPQDS